MFNNAPPPSPRPRAHHVKVTVRITPDAVARAERDVTPLRETLAFRRQHADQSAIVLNDVNNILRVDIDHCRPDELGRPNVQQLAVLIEHLHPVILTIRHQQTPAPVYPHRVRQVELARRSARLAP